LCWSFKFLILNPYSCLNWGIAQEMVTWAAFYDLVGSIEKKILIWSMIVINYIFHFIVEYNIMYKNKSLKRMKATIWWWPFERGKKNHVLRSNKLFDDALFHEVLSNHVISFWVFVIFLCVGSFKFLILVSWSLKSRSWGTEKWFSNRNLVRNGGWLRAILDSWDATSLHPWLAFMPQLGTWGKGGFI